MEDTVKITAEELKGYIERIEKLEQEKRDVQDHIRDVYAKATDEGWDIKVMKQIIRLRKMDDDDREEQEILLDTYKQHLNAIGLYGITEHHRRNFAPISRAL
ncbi:conserved hypothetical protein [Wolbachia endosymbiont of Drosophila ananassae]|nr:conserved hypothetical protein [Wolbachia endosymbiont of Drosophila ananassae]